MDRFVSLPVPDTGARPKAVSVGLRERSSGEEWGEAGVGREGPSQAGQPSPAGL